jgi:hypothetical protein
MGDCRFVQVTDNNDIDREVTEYKPTHVIIEALWVIPEKFHVLRKLHPSVTWIARVHSELPFLANEGVAIDWMCNYVQHDKVIVSGNSTHAAHDLWGIIRRSNPGWSDGFVGQKLVSTSAMKP